MPPSEYGLFWRRAGAVFTVAAIGLGLELGAFVPVAEAATRAGTLIGNQASASFTDGSGLPQISTSNLVQTVVANVGSFTNVAGSTKSAGAGNIAYMPHAIQNTGNFDDALSITVNDGAGAGTFAKIEVYADANADGLPDGAALCSVTSGACSVSSQTVAASSTFNFITAYSIPSTATTPTTPFDSPTAVVAPVSSANNNNLADYTSSAAQTSTDTINLTTAAAFAVNKSISRPGVSAPTTITGGWPAAITGGEASAATCTATVAGINAGGACSYTVYTVRYTNNGGNAGDVYIKDVIGTGLTAGLTYVPNTAMWSGRATSTALAEGTPTASQSGILFGAAGGATTTVEAVVPNVPVGGTGTLSFVVMAKATATVGTGSTSNKATYTALDCGTTSGTAGDGTIASCSANTQSSSNASPFTVLQTYGVAAGSTSSTAVTAVDASYPPSATGTAGVNDVVVDRAILGGVVSYTNRVYNLGNGADSFNVTLGTPANFPAGTTFLLYAADGATPLGDANSDGVPDTGEIPVGAFRDIVVKAILPGTGVTNAALANVLITATSTGATTKKDGVNNSIKANGVIPTAVDITAAGQASCPAGVDCGKSSASLAVVATKSTVAGTAVTYDLYVKNFDTATNSFALGAGQTSVFPGTLPAGWSVTYAAPSVVSGTCSGTASALSVSANGECKVVATVTPPAGTAAGTYPLWFEAKGAATGSGGGITVSDFTRYALTVSASAALKQLTLASNNTGNVAPGGSVTYAHTLTNTGTLMCGSTNDPSLTVSVSSSAGWSINVFHDANGDSVLDAGDLLLATGVNNLDLQLQTGQEKKLLVKVFAPGGAGAGASDVTTLTVTDNSSSACPVSGSAGGSSVTNTSVVVLGQVRVDKYQVRDATCAALAPTVISGAQIQAKPGECVVYKVVALNEGSQAVTDVSVTDVTPANTTFNATQPTAACAATSLTTSTTDLTTASPARTPATVSGGTTGSIKCAGAAANALQPGGSVTLQYSVKID